MWSRYFSIALSVVLLAGCQTETDEEMRARIERGSAETLRNLYSIIEEGKIAIETANCPQIEHHYYPADMETAARFYPRIMAHLYLNGICLERAPERAFEILKAAVADDAEANTLARLGDLYWRGEGVAKDEAEANRLFRYAVLHLVPDVLYLRITEEFDDYPLSGIWGLAPEDFMVGFMDPATGPWPLPDPLIEQRRLLDKVSAEGGPAVRRIATHLYEGTGGYPQDRSLALAWIRAAAYNLEYQPAYYEMFLWSQDFPPCEAESRPLTCHDQEIANWHLYRAAEGGVRDAVALVTACLDQVPEMEQRGLALYFWRFKSRHLGLPVSQEDLDAAAREATPTEREVADEWIQSGDRYAFVDLGEANCYR